MKHEHAVVVQIYTYYIGFSQFARKSKTMVIYNRIISCNILIENQSYSNNNVYDTWKINIFILQHF